MGANRTVLDPTQTSPEVRDFETALRQRVVGQERIIQSFQFEQHRAAIVERFGIIRFQRGGPFVTE